MLHSFTRVCFNNLVNLKLLPFSNLQPFTRVCFNNLVNPTQNVGRIWTAFTRVCFNNLVNPQIRTRRVSSITSDTRNCLLSFLFSRFPSQVVNQPKSILYHFMQNEQDKRLGIFFCLMKIAMNIVSLFPIG